MPMGVSIQSKFFYSKAALAGVQPVKAIQARKMIQRATNTPEVTSCQRQG
jgi:hypothetical protein